MWKKQGKHNNMIRELKAMTVCGFRFNHLDGKVMMTNA